MKKEHPDHPGEPPEHVHRVQQQLLDSNPPTIPAWEVAMNKKYGLREHDHKVPDREADDKEKEISKRLVELVHRRR